MCLCRCLSGHNSEEALKRHHEYCGSTDPVRVVMPEDPKLTFVNYHKQLKCPYIIYADTEALVKPFATTAATLSNTTRDNVHEVSHVWHIFENRD